MTVTGKLRMNPYEEGWVRVDLLRGLQSRRSRHVLSNRRYPAQSAGEGITTTKNAIDFQQSQQELGSSGLW